MTELLRPLERRVLDMTASGLDRDQIAARIKRSPAHVDRILGWARIPRSRPPTRRAAHAIERRVLDLRSAGETHEQIAARFKRGERSIRQIEGLAHFRLAMDLLERQETTR